MTDSRSVEDAALAARPWGFALQEITLPVHIWHGEEDGNSPVAAARYLAQAIPGSRLRIWSGEGHFSMLRHLRDQRLLATFTVGFGIMFNFIAAFTFIGFVLAAEPFSLSPAAIGLVFIVYLYRSLEKGQALMRWALPLVLGGTNSYLGPTNVNEGTLSPGAAGGFSAASAFTVAAGANIELRGLDASIGSLAGVGTVTNSNVTAAVLTTAGLVDLGREQGIRRFQRR